MRNFLLILSLLGFSLAYAQTPPYRVLEIPVWDSITPLTHPWTGGMNDCVVQPIDLDNDGREDLLVMDRNGNKLLTFRNNGSTTAFSYDYAPQYENIFPAAIYNWVLVRDFNSDGVPDLFTFDNANGIVCYIGSRSSGNLSFRQHLQSMRYFDQSVGYWDRILPNTNDIPIIKDIDRDGDMDVVVPSFWSGLSMSYYKNQRVESSYSKDSMVFILETTCWGGFQKRNTSAILMACKNGSSPVPPALQNRHSNGGPLMDFDYENDGDVDILVSNVGNSNLVFLQNGGDSSFADMVYIDSTFPTYNVPVQLKMTPAMFNIDVNNDGAKDLIVTSFNYDLLDIGLMTDINNLYYYKNKKLTDKNEFEFVRKNLFENGSFDVGTDAAVTPFDYNHDGKMDMVVSNHSSFDATTDLYAKFSRLCLLENIGTPDSPAFKIVSKDWFNLSQYMLNSVRPAFGDIDGDSLPDMVIGESTGRLHFFKNTGTINNPGYSSMTTPSMFGLNVGANSFPFLYDVNKDTLLDLVVGRKDGKISYFPNIGRNNAPQYDLMIQNANFGNIKTSNTSASIANSSPFIVSENGKDILYTGSFFIQTEVYEINPDSIDRGTFALIDSNVANERIGYNATIAVADLNNDGHKEYLVGTSRGGVVIYSDTIMDKQSPNAVDYTTPTTVAIYPNPAHTTLNVAAEYTIEKIELTDMLGRVVLQKNNLSENNAVLDIADVPSGIYAVVVSLKNEKIISKIVIQK